MLWGRVTWDEAVKYGPQLKELEAEYDGARVAHAILSRNLSLPEGNVGQ